MSRKKKKSKKKQPVNTIERFIITSCSKIESAAYDQVEREYMRRHNPLKRGELRDFRESRERRTEAQKILARDPFYKALTGPDPANDPAVQEAWDQRRQEDLHRRMVKEAEFVIQGILGDYDLYEFIDTHVSRETLERPIIDYFRDTEFYTDDILMELIREHEEYYPEDFFDGLFDDYFVGTGRLYYGQQVENSGRSWSSDENSQINSFLFDSGCIEEGAAAVTRALMKTPAFGDAADKYGAEELRDALELYIQGQLPDYFLYDIVDDFQSSADYLPLILSGSYPESARAAVAVYNRRTREKTERIRREHAEKKRLEKELEEKILTRMPDRYIDFFPRARGIQRHFILHIGPTNSGKTHDALNRYLQAESGIYLAPLRLLAHEIYEYSINEDVPCSMITGEEEILTEGASHISSTVEMLELHAHYDVAVIDEAQMIIDRDRGYAWTNAICGVYAEEIHVCMAPEALDLVQDLIHECGDTSEVVRHERMTPLVCDHSFRKFPDDVRPHDALIVFSRRDVHACAADLRHSHVRASLIYGALPYPVRKKEVQKFLEGETDVVVSTDAIGMGMNLPIQRIVFLQTTKFDGVESRSLYPEEFRQIAGRAGRRGMYNKGYYASEFDDVQLKGLHTVIDHAPISFPETLLTLDEPMNQLVQRWNNLPRQGVFKVSKIDLELCEMLCAQTEDKRLIYDFLSLPVDEKSEVLRDLWFQLFLLELTWAPGSEQLFAQMCDIRYNSQDQSDLELAHRKCDLLYSYARKFKHPEMKDHLVEERQLISQQIMKLLDSQNYAQRRCSRCGRMLPWNYPFGICQTCYSQSRGNRRGGRRRRSGSGRRRRG